MNHSVVSILNEQPAKVRCRTCHSDHDYRHEQAPPPKVDLRKQALFNEVLEKVDPTAEDEEDEEMMEEEAPKEESSKEEAPKEVEPPAAKPKKKVKGK
jgi:hypothetical protein